MTFLGIIDFIIKICFHLCPYACCFWFTQAKKKFDHRTTRMRTKKNYLAIDQMQDLSSFIRLSSLVLLISRNNKYKCSDKRTLTWDAAWMWPIMKERERENKKHEISRCSPQKWLSFHHINKIDNGKKGFHSVDNRFPSFSFLKASSEIHCSILSVNNDTWYFSNNFSNAQHSFSNDFSFPRKCLKPPLFSLNFTFIHVKSRNANGPVVVGATAFQFH